jgi:RNA polymerase sigma-70 factor (ECF subfamily)
VLHYQHRLYAFALRQTGSSQDAEDIVQEAFLQAYYALAGYPQKRVQTLRLQPWLYKITHNIFISRVRRVRLEHVSLDDTDGSIRAMLEDDVSTQPEMVLEERESLRELESLVVTLPEQYREAVNLYYFEELNVWCELR